ASPGLRLAGNTCHGHCHRRPLLFAAPRLQRLLIETHVSLTVLNNSAPGPCQVAACGAQSAAAPAAGPASNNSQTSATQSLPPTQVTCMRCHRLVGAPGTATPAGDAIACAFPECRRVCCTDKVCKGPYFVGNDAARAVPLCFFHYAPLVTFADPSL